MSDRHRVLLVEDNSGDAWLIREMLQSASVEPIEVETAERLADGLRLLGSQSFDAVLLDLGLPDSRGLETFTRLSAESPGTPVVVMTGNDDLMLALRAVQAGAQDYLVKGQVQGNVLARSVRYAVERKRAEAALRESERKYKHFFEQDLAGHYVSTADGKVTACNAAFARILGYGSAGEAIGADLVSCYAGPEARAEFLRRLQADGRAERMEIELRRKDGSAVAVIESAVAVRDARGGLQEIHGFLIDDTERKRVEAEFRQAQKMEAVGRVAGGVAHDFTNLLSVIIGYAELLQQRLPEDHPHRGKLDQIRSAADRGVELTRQLLAFSRKQALQPRALELNRVVREMGGMLRRLIGEDIALVTNLCDEAGLVMADPGQLEQVIMNLVLNARDAMPCGGTLTIATAQRKQEGARPHPGMGHGPLLELSVRDTGCGMDRETLARVFEPFFTTKEAGKGTGLGLATVYGVVKQSRGHVTVESAPGQGTTFRIWFPLVGEEARERPARAQEPAPKGGSETILLLEDDAWLRSMAQEALEGAGYQVLSAACPEEGRSLALAHGETIDLLLSDVIMPGMNGPDFATELIALRPQLRTLYMSGYTDEGLARRGVAAAGANLLQKPFTPEDLLREVRAALDCGAERREPAKALHGAADES